MQVATALRAGKRVAPIEVEKARKTLAFDPERAAQFDNLVLKADQATPRTVVATAAGRPVATGKKPMAAASRPVAASRPAARFPDGVTPNEWRAYSTIIKRMQNGYTPVTAERRMLATTAGKLAPGDLLAKGANPVDFQWYLSFLARDEEYPRSADMRRAQAIATAAGHRGAASRIASGAAMMAAHERQVAVAQARASGKQPSAPTPVELAAGKAVKANVSRRDYRIAHQIANHPDLSKVSYRDLVHARRHRPGQRWHGRGRPARK